MPTPSAKFKNSRHIGKDKEIFENIKQEIELHIKDIEEIEKQQDNGE